jgi:hypothetical protein
MIDDPNGSNYPLHLIPSIDAKIISEIDEKHHLAVYVETNDEIPLVDAAGKLNRSLIKPVIPGFSTNKIPSSLNSDLQIAFNDDVKKHYRQDWQEGVLCERPPNEHFHYVPTRKLYYLPIGQINNFTDKYRAPEAAIDSRFRVRVVHKPLIANFWHFELEVLDAAETPIKYSTSVWKRPIFSVILDQIHNMAVFAL